jgi:hypothetical protein
MTLIELPFSLPGFEVDEISDINGLLEVTARSIESAEACLTCQQCSSRIHSYYRRAPADLPISDRKVRLHLTVRRFRCQNPTCARATFAERWPTLSATHVQRMERMTTALGAVAFAVGGQAGSQLALRLQMPTSGDTLLRIIRRRPTNTPRPTITKTPTVTATFTRTGRAAGPGTHQARRAFRPGQPAPPAGHRPAQAGAAPGRDQHPDPDHYPDPDPDADDYEYPDADGHVAHQHAFINCPLKLLGWNSRELERSLRQASIHHC